MATKFRRAATEFLVWRAGVSVGWDCSASDIAAEVGVSSSYVHVLAKRRGWKLASRWGGRVTRPAVDKLMTDGDFHRFEP